MKLGPTEKNNPEETVQEWVGTIIFWQKCSYNHRFPIGTCGITQRSGSSVLFAFVNKDHIAATTNNGNINEKNIKKEKKEIECFHPLDMHNQIGYFTEKINICKYVFVIQEFIEDLYNCPVN